MRMVRACLRVFVCVCVEVFENETFEFHKECSKMPILKQCYGKNWREKEKGKGSSAENDLFTTPKEETAERKRG